VPAPALPLSPPCGGEDLEVAGVAATFLTSGSESAGPPTASAKNGQHDDRAVNDLIRHDERCYDEFPGPANAAWASEAGM